MCMRHAFCFLLCSGFVYAFIVVYLLGLFVFVYSLWNFFNYMFDYEANNKQIKLESNILGCKHFQVS